jgi:hypothetical protein
MASWQPEVLPRHDYQTLIILPRSILKSAEVTSTLENQGQVLH